MPEINLANGVTFACVHSALRDPGGWCKRITSYPAGTRQLEPMERWQTRAVLAALAKLHSHIDSDASRKERGTMADLPEVVHVSDEEMEHYLMFPELYCRTCEGGYGPQCIDCANADDPSDPAASRREQKP